VFYIMEHIFSAISPKDQVVVLSCCRAVVLSCCRVVVLSIELKIYQEWEVSPCLQPVKDAGLPPPPLC